MDPDRVGTTSPVEVKRLSASVSNLYGSRQSRDFLFVALAQVKNQFPIYMDPDRVGTSVVAYVKSLVGGQFPIYMDPDRVGTQI